MIEFYGITYVAECDSCSDTFDTDCDREEGFVSAVSAIKREGWKVSKIGDEWVHTCPCCQDNEIEGMFE